MNLSNTISIQYVENSDGEKYAVNIRNAGLLTTVPMNEENSDYKEILKQVDEGTITIAEAD